jgi:hypothetical protein
MTIILMLSMFAIFLTIDYFMKKNKVAVPEPETAALPAAAPSLPTYVAGFDLPNNRNYHQGHTWALQESPTLDCRAAERRLHWSLHRSTGETKSTFCPSRRSVANFCPWRSHWPRFGRTIPSILPARRVPKSSRPTRTPRPLSMARQHSRIGERRGAFHGCCSGAGVAGKRFCSSVAPRRKRFAHLRRHGENSHSHRSRRVQRQSNPGCGAARHRPCHLAQQAEKICLEESDSRRVVNHIQILPLGSIAPESFPVWPLTLSWNSANLVNFCPKNLIPLLPIT